MTEKNSRRKKNADFVPVSLSDDRKRFGAVAFFDSRMEEGDDGEEAILSLDSLREAFAAFDLEQCELPSDDESAGTSGETGTISDNVEETSDDFEEPVNNVDEEDAFEPTLKTILEAMLFVGDRDNRPLTAERAAENMRNVLPEEIGETVFELNRHYDQFACPYHIIGDRNGYRMVLRPEFEAIRKNFYGKNREATLSQQAIDTLAVVAYRQPISAEEVQKLRKENCVNTLSLLVRRGLLNVERETRNKRKVTVYRTTERFLQLFHLDSLDELPFSEEVEG